MQTAWIHVKTIDTIIGGVYRRFRSSVDEERIELSQLENQIFYATQTGKNVLVLGDTNMDHNNPSHKMYKEAANFLSVLEVASMRHMPNSTPTWKSFGLHKACKCLGRDCSCPKLQKSSCIDNAYISLKADAALEILDDALTDHYPLLVKLTPRSNSTKRSALKTIWRRDTSKLSAMEFESVLACVDWTDIYNTDDPNIVLDIIIKNVNASLDLVAPLKKISYRQDKPKLSLKKDTLAAMEARNVARKSGNKNQYKNLRNIVNKLVKRDKIQGTLYAPRVHK